MAENILELIGRAPSADLALFIQDDKLACGMDSALCKKVRTRS